jgi:RNAse (barnase) inhibitor barstar
MSDTDNLQEAEGTEGITKETSNPKLENQIEQNDALQAIANENAEDAEDQENSKRHEIETKDYHSMDMDSLVEEFSSLVNNHPIQAISKQFNQLKDEFNAKFSELIDIKKEAFLAEGGNIIDFNYSSNAKKQIQPSLWRIQNETKRLLQ